MCKLFELDYFHILSTSRKACVCFCYSMIVCVTQLYQIWGFAISSHNHPRLLKRRSKFSHVEHTILCIAFESANCPLTLKTNENKINILNKKYT